MSETYDFVARLLQKHGRPNPVFAQDLDLEYGKLRELTGGQVNGLPSILKHMKKNKRVDYTAPMLQDDSIVTLVADYNAEANFGTLSDEQLRALDGSVGQAMAAKRAPKKTARSVKYAKGPAKFKAKTAPPKKAPAAVKKQAAAPKKQALKKQALKKQAPPPAAVKWAKGPAKSKGKGNFGELLAASAQRPAFKQPPPDNGEAERKRKAEEEERKRKQQQEEEERKRKQQQEAAEAAERKRQEEAAAAAAAVAAAEEEEEEEEEEAAWGEEEEGWGEEEEAYYEEEEAYYEEEEAEEGAYVATCTAIGDWQGENPGDLSFSTGDTIYIIDNTSDPEGWWQGTVGGVTGWAPCTYLQLNE